MTLAGQVFEFRNASVAEIIRVIHDRRWLKPFHLARLMFKLERAIW